MDCVSHMHTHIHALVAVTTLQGATCKSHMHLHNDGTASKCPTPLPFLFTSAEYTVYFSPFHIGPPWASLLFMDGIDGGDGPRGSSSWSWAPLRGMASQLQAIRMDGQDAMNWTGQTHVCSAVFHLRSGASWILIPHLWRFRNCFKSRLCLS